MISKRFFFWRILGSIKKSMPSFVSKAIIRLLPLAFFLSCIEIAGLVLIVPVIRILLDTRIIYENPHLYKMFLLIDAKNEIEFLVFFLALIVLFFIVKNFVFYWASFRQTKITYSVAERLTSLQFQLYLLQPYKLHVKDNTSILLRKIIEIPYNFITGIMLPVVQVINEFIVLLLIIVGILIYNWFLFVSMVLFVVPFFLLYSKLYKKQLSKVSKEREVGHSEMFRKGRQGIEGFREIILFNKLNYFKPQFHSAVGKFSDAMAKIYHLNALSPKIIETLAILCVLTIFVVGIVLGYNIEKLVAFLATFTLGAYRLIPSVNKLILSYNNIRSSEFVFDHFRTVSWSQGDGVDSEDMEPLSFEKQIKLSNISFSFYEEKRLLNDINLSINKGEIIGIVGKSGSGKSTLINIMLGLYQPTMGKVLVDDVEINQFNLKSWHRTIGYVPQNPVLMEGTIQENIAFGEFSDKVDETRLQWAVKNSGLKDFVSDLPLGLKSIIGDKSLNISGGQRQRIAIARALYHQGKVLIFDEATSSLDRETEQLLTESIRHLRDQNYTIIIVAHRIEALKYCDRIFKIKDGKLSDSLAYNEIVEWQK